MTVREGLQVEFRPWRPPTAVYPDRKQVTRYREDYFPVTASDQHRVFCINLDGTFMAPGAIQDLILPVGQAIRSGAYGPAVLIVATSDDATGDFVQSLAERNSLSLFILSSAEDALTSARPVGAATPAEAETIQLVCQAGGEITSSGFAHLAGIEISAAVNRLSGLAKKGYVYRFARSRREGDIYLDPRVAVQEASFEAEAVPAGQTGYEDLGPGDGRLAQLTSAFEERLLAMSSSEGTERLREAFETAPTQLGRAAPGEWRRRVTRDVRR